MWVGSKYCWVVVCKNHWFHRRRNFSNVHRIPLGVTDAVLPRPQSINHLGFAAMNVARNIGTSHWRYLDMKWTRLLRSFPILCFVTNSRTTRLDTSRHRLTLKSEISP